MATCHVCNGGGTTFEGYPSCSACGGRGHNGSDTAVPCTACGGSGTSSQQDWRSCWNCAGTGRVADPPLPKTSAPALKPKAKGKPHRGGGNGEVALPSLGFGVVAGFCAYVWMVDRFSFDARWQPIAIAAVVGYLSMALWPHLGRLLVAAAAGGAAYLFLPEVVDYADRGDLVFQSLAIAVLAGLFWKLVAWVMVIGIAVLIWLYLQSSGQI